MYKAGLLAIRCDVDEGVHLWITMISKYHAMEGSERFRKNCCDVTVNSYEVNNTMITIIGQYKILISKQVMLFGNTWLA